MYRRQYKCDNEESGNSKHAIDIHFCVPQKEVWIVYRPSRSRHDSVGPIEAGRKIQPQRKGILVEVGRKTGHSSLGVSFEVGRKSLGAGRRVYGVLKETQTLLGLSSVEVGRKY